MFHLLFPIKNVLSQGCGDPSSGGGSSTSRAPSALLDANLNVSPSTTTTPPTNINDNTGGESASTQGDINLNTPGAVSSTTTTASTKEKSNLNADQPFYVDPNANCLSDVNKVLREVGVYHYTVAPGSVAAHVLGYISC